LQMISFILVPVSLIASDANNFVKKSYAT